MDKFTTPLYVAIRKGFPLRGYFLSYTSMSDWMRRSGLGVPTFNNTQEVVIKRGISHWYIVA